MRPKVNQIWAFCGSTSDINIFVMQACSELVDAGVDLADLSSGNLTGLVVTTDDCNTLGTELLLHLTKENQIH